MRKNLMQQTFNVLVCSPEPASRAGSGWQFNGNKPCADDSHGSRARQNKRMPEVSREDIIVRQGKDRLQVTGWTPLSGEICSS
jgi:hypothetical protein